MVSGPQIAFLSARAAVAVGAQAASVATATARDVVTARSRTRSRPAAPCERDRPADRQPAEDHRQRDERHLRAGRAGPAELGEGGAIPSALGCALPSRGGSAGGTPRGPPPRPRGLRG